MNSQGHKALLSAQRSGFSVLNFELSRRFCLSEGMSFLSEISFLILRNIGPFTNKF